MLSGATGLVQAAPRLGCVPGLTLALYCPGPCSFTLSLSLLSHVVSYLGLVSSLTLRGGRSLSQEEEALLHTDREGPA